MVFTSSFKIATSKMVGFAGVLLAVNNFECAHAIAEPCSFTASAIAMGVANVYFTHLVNTAKKEGPTAMFGCFKNWWDDAANAKMLNIGGQVESDPAKMDEFYDKYFVEGDVGIGRSDFQAGQIVKIDLPYLYQNYWQWGGQIIGNKIGTDTYQHIKYPEQYGVLLGVRLTESGDGENLIIQRLVRKVEVDGGVKNKFIAEEDFFIPEDTFFQKGHNQQLWEGTAENPNVFKIQQIISAVKGNKMSLEDLKKSCTIRRALPKDSELLYDAPEDQPPTASELMAKAAKMVAKRRMAPARLTLPPLPPIGVWSNGTPMGFFSNGVPMLTQGQRLTQTTVMVVPAPPARPRTGTAMAFGVPVQQDARVEHLLKPTPNFPRSLSQASTRSGSSTPTSLGSPFTKR